MNTHFAYSAAPHFSPDERRWFYVLLLIAAGLIFIGLGLRDPWPADEPRFAQVAKEMVESGQWFFPARGGEYYPDKPPIFMWSIAIFYALTGSLTIAFLLPSALCAMLTLVLVVDIGKKLWGPRTGLYAGALLVASFQFMLQAKTAQIDAMVCCWITIGCYSLLRFMLFDGLWRWYFLGFFFMGIGVITKGVGFLPLLMLLPYWLFRHRATQQKIVIPHNEHWLKWVAGPLTMLCAIGLWFVPMLLLIAGSDDPLLAQYRDNILFKQTVTRYADSWHHIKPFYYYFTQVIPVFWLPLSLALPWLVPHWYKAIKRNDGRIVLPALWILLLLLFFSLSPGKRGVYILPALPMLALISAPYLNALVQRSKLTWLVWGVAAILATLLAIAGIGGMLDMSFAQKFEQKYDLQPWAFLLTTGLCAFVLCVAALKRARYLAWAGLMGALWIGYSTWGYQLLNEVKTPKNVFRTMQQTISDGAEIALVDFSEQFILFSPYPVTHFGFHTPHDDQLQAAYHWLEEGQNRHVLIDFNTINGKCFDASRAQHMGFAHRTDWVLLGKDDRLASCAEPPSSVHQYRWPK